MKKRVSSPKSEIAFDPFRVFRTLSPSQEETYFGRDRTLTLLLHGPMQEGLPEETEAVLDADAIEENL